MPYRYVKCPACDSILYSSNPGGYCLDTNTEVDFVEVDPSELYDLELDK